MDAVSFSRNVRGVDEIQARRLFTDHDERLGLLESGEGTESIKIVNLDTDWSAGDNQSGYSAVVPGQRLSIKHGTAATPDVVAAPTAKVVRTSAVTQAAIDTAEGSGGSDGGDVMAAIMGVHVGTAASGSQTVGVAGFAKNASNAEENPDACGIYGVGRITGGTSAKAAAFGAYLAGRRDVATAKATGIELQVQNYTATPGSYLATGSSDTKGIWLSANGGADSGVGLQINNPFGRQFQVGIGFGEQETGGKKGGIAETSIRDDSSSIRSILIRGAHEKAAIAIAAGAGPVVIGGETLGTASARLEVIGAAESQSPLVDVGSGASNFVYAIRVRNSSGNASMFVSAGTNNVMTGTAVGDSGVAVTAGKIFHIGCAAKTSMVRVGETTLGFYGVAPVARAGAITSPAAELGPLKTAVDAIRVALTNIGITS